MSNSDDSSSSEESINSPSEEKNDSLSPMKNGLTFAPRCDGQCFIQQAECDHTIQFATLKPCRRIGGVSVNVVPPWVLQHHTKKDCHPSSIVYHA